MKFFSKVNKQIKEHKKATLLFSSFVVLIFSVTLVGFHFAHAGVAEYIQEAMFWLATVLLRLEGAVMQTLMTGFSVFMHYDLYFQEDFVLTGWGVVRDLVNLLFILVLMIIALMSILRVQESVVRHLLPRFVFAVLLVNFSFFFCRVVVGAADSLSTGFLGGITGLSTAVFKYIQAFKSFELKSGGELAWASVTAAWLAVVFLLFVAVAILVISVCMLVRIVAICVLVVLSPFAFLALILPSTAGLANKWMKNLFSYAFWGPAAVFFVWLSVITFVSNSSPISTVLDLTSTPAVSASVGTVTGQLMKFVVVSIFLYIAIIAGKLLGNTGADLGMKAVSALPKVAGKMLGGASKVAGTVLGGASALAGTRGLGKALKKGVGDWASRNTSTRAEAFTSALKNGSRAGAARAALGFGKRGQPMLSTQRKNKEQAKREAEHQSTYEKMSGAQQQEAWTKLSGMTDKDSMEKKRALLRVGAKNGDLNKFLGKDAHLPGQIGTALGKAGFGKDETGKLQNDLASISDKSDHGDKRYAALSGFNGKEFQANDSEGYTNAITDHVDDRIEKGEGKKLSPKMFGEDQAGIAAIAGLKGGTGVTGEPISIQKTIKGSAWAKIQEHSRDGGYHDMGAKAAQQALDNPAMKKKKSVQFRVGNKVVKMSRDKAERYVRNVEQANGKSYGATSTLPPASTPAPPTPGPSPTATIAPPAGPPPKRGAAMNRANPNKPHSKGSKKP